MTGELQNEREDLGEGYQDPLMSTIIPRLGVKGTTLLNIQSCQMMLQSLMHSLQYPVHKNIH